jgi:hypothetical protein
MLSSGKPNTEIDAGDGMKKGFLPKGLSCFTLTLIFDNFRDFPPKNFPLPLQYLSPLLPLFVFCKHRSIKVVFQLKGLKAAAGKSFFGIWCWFWM